MEKSEILKREGMYLSTPSGNSMRPLLRGGKDTVVIRPAPDRLARFDICLYRRPDGKDVLHRVIRVRGACYDIRGDGCDYTEHGVPHGRVIGVMEGFFRGFLVRTAPICPGVESAVSRTLVRHALLAESPTDFEKVK